MIAIWLRCCLAAEFAALAMAWLLLQGFAGLRTATAAAAAAAVVIALNAGMVAAKYAFARLRGGARPREHKVAAWRILCAAIGEALACVLAFGVIQPFEQWWMGPDPTGPAAPGRMPVLLVHGYLCNRGLWWWFRRQLRTRGILVATVNLEPPLGGIDGFVPQLHARIEALVAGTGADRVLLVGHSMAGLVARAYLRRHGAGRIAGLVTLATPHHGTRTACFAPGRNAREMQPDSAWLRQLASGEVLGVPTLSIWSAGDGTVVPPDSARLAGAREKVLATLGHQSMVFSPLVIDLVQAELANTENRDIDAPPPPDIVATTGSGGR